MLSVFLISKCNPGAYFIGFWGRAESMPVNLVKYLQAVPRPTHSIYFRQPICRRLYSQLRVATGQPPTEKTFDN
jgi:hypothetical protein